MKYLENAIRFITKHYILAVPLFISTALAALLGGSTSGFIGKAWEVLADMRAEVDFFNNPAGIISFLTSAAVVSGIGFLSFILTIIVTPATYGMVNKALNEGFATLNDFVPQFKNNIAKYLIFWVGTLVLWLGFGILVALFGLISALFIAISKWLGILFIVIMFLLIIIAVVYVGVNMSLWFPAMVVENIDVLSAFKKSFSLVKRNFLMILGINLLVGIVASLASLILSILGMIPLLGSIILSIVPTASSFTMIVFFLMYYKGENANLV